MNFLSDDFTIEKTVFACKVPAGTGEVVHKNRPSHGLALHASGDRDYIFESGETLNVKRNDIIFLPENSSYEVKTNVPGDCLAINFKISESDFKKPFVFHAKNSSEFLRAFSDAEKAFRAKSAGWQAKCKAEIYSVVYAMICEKNAEYTSNSTKSLILPALKYIHAHYTEENINIPHLCDLCMVSEAYFRRIFLKTCGVAPIKYINNLRIARAKELLLQSEFSIETVAKMSGFNNPYWFCKYFKRHTKTTPSEYRKTGVET